MAITVSSLILHNRHNRIIISNSVNWSRLTVNVIPAQAGIQKPYGLVRLLKYRLFLSGIIISYRSSIKIFHSFLANELLLSRDSQKDSVSAFLSYPASLNLNHSVR